MQCITTKRGQHLAVISSGSGKSSGKFAEISFGAKFPRKARKSQEIRRSSFALLLHNTVIEVRMGS